MVVRGPKHSLSEKGCRMRAFCSLGALPAAEDVTLVAAMHPMQVEPVTTQQLWSALQVLRQSSQARTSWRTMSVTCRASMEAPHAE